MALSIRTVCTLEKPVQSTSTQLTASPKAIARCMRMENESNMSSHSSLSQTEYVPSQRTSPDTTGASDVAVTMGGTPKRTASASFWLASEGPAACYVSGVTCAFSAQFCTACDADSGMFLTDNACHSSAALVGKCRVYATDGGGVPHLQRGVRLAREDVRPM